MWQKRFSFTLIELLICVAIIVILVALLLPVLGRVKEKARVVTDISNHRQSATGIFMYARDNKSKMVLAPPTYSMVCYYNGAYDLATSYANYVDFEIFKCIEQIDAPAIDDPQNTRFARYMTLMYFPGRLNTSLYPGTRIPYKLSSSTAQTPLISCTIRQNPSIGYFGQHTRRQGVFQTFSSQGNPSLQRYKGDSLGPIFGTVIAYMDGSSVWADTRSLTKFKESGGTNFWTTPVE